VDTLFVALRIIVSLAAVVGVLFVLQRRITKGSAASRSTKLVSVVTRQGISQKASVVVLDVEGQRYLLGVTEHSVTVLNSADAPEPEPVPLKAVAPLTSPNQFGTANQFSNVSKFDTMFADSLMSPATWKRAAAALRRHG
jgi:flagellar protein FliO/FliZ